MSYFQLQVITLSEFGRASSRSIPGRWADKAAALGASVDVANAIAGPERDGYRRPAVSIEFDAVLGATVKVGNGDVDGEIHLVYAMELGRMER